MPMPSTVQLGRGNSRPAILFDCVAGFQDATLDRGVQRFLNELSHQTGLRLLQRRGNLQSDVGDPRDHAVRLCKPR